jgi:HEAT repeat protein
LGRFALTAIEAGYKSILPDWFVSKHLAQPHPELFEKAIDLGWLNRVGVDAENPLKSVYAFYHPSFQEYFAACEIEDWHFFLNHVPENPQQGIYRIFERQWKEVMLLWMGRKDVDREEKEAFIKALVEFDDGCKYFYGYRAYFLAAVLIDEFKDCSLADAIVAQIVKWEFGHFNFKEQEWQRFLAPIAERAKAVLPETDRTRVIVTLTKLIRTSENASIQQQAANSLGEIGKDNPDVVATLTELIRTSENQSIRLQAAYSLGKIDKGNLDAIAALTELIRTYEDEDTRRWAYKDTQRWAASRLGEIDEALALTRTRIFPSSPVQAADLFALRNIGKGDPDVIATLSELICTSENGDIRWLAAESLREIGKGNPDALPALNELICTSENGDIRWQAAENLGKIGKENLDAIAALTELIRTSENEFILWWVANSLGKIGKENLDAIAALIELIHTSKNNHVWSEAANSLKKIGKGNAYAIATLIDLIRNDNSAWRLLYAPEVLDEICKGSSYASATLTQLILTSEDEYTWKLADRLKIILTETQQMTGVVTALKDCLSDETFKNDFYRFTNKNDFERFKNSYKVIWHCAQNLPYPTFYHAWHHPQITPHPEVPDWQTFPQDIAREINNQAELSNQMQLLSIDGKNFINPDNPAAKIYTQMLKQGCPKSEDGTPKTMADLQTYWDFLLMDSEKSFILVFYNSRGEEATGFSETFVNDLSKFDGNIAIVSENNAHSLAAFSPSQSDLIGTIVRWICQVVWES